MEIQFDFCLHLIDLIVTNVIIIIKFLNNHLIKIFPNLTQLNVNSQHSMNNNNFQIK